MKKITRYLRYAFGLLKLNIGTLLVFELLYKFASMAVFKPLISGLMKLALKVQGLSFLSDETMGNISESTADMGVSGGDCAGNGIFYAV